MLEKTFWSVAVEAPLPKGLTYFSFDPLSSQIKEGMSVTVPLGKRTARGLVMSKSEDSGEYELKEILELDTELPTLAGPFLKWLQWVAEYYFYPLGLVTAQVFPPLAKKTDSKTRKQPVIPQVDLKKPHTLNSQQQKVVNNIDLGQFSAHLIHGVTGSGKTEVYLELLEKILAQGKQGLVLVPEISLTPQLVHRFAQRFGDHIAVIHSQLTEREKTNQWWDIVEGRKKILIGARSALFCPMPNLGLIVIDEEHEASFKQDEKLKYNGRDAAVMLARSLNIPILMGSATPSLESWKNAREGKYSLHQMTERVSKRALPIIEVVDMRAAEKNPDLPYWFSTQLFEAIQETLDKNEQVALFLNRRGQSQVVLCRSCGYSKECPNCDIGMTLHRDNHLICHYCDYHENFSLTCPSCKQGELSPVGIGTELLEQEILRMFPGKTVARADRDEIQNRQDLEDMITRMEKGEIDILIGTQMIAKGLDFEKLTLVGLILADVGFHLPDFRATERSFQLITQVSGRAGRHSENPGKVLIQTYNPDHPSVTFSQAHNYEEFADQELAIRSALLYPPVGRIAMFRTQSLHLTKSQRAIQQLATRAQKLQSRFPKVEILGPTQAPIAKLRGQFRHHLMFKSTDVKSLHQMIYMVLGDQKWVEAGTRILVDIDPLHLL